MIFITAGSTKFQFKRLENLSHKIASTYLKERVVFQNIRTNNGNFPKNLIIHKSLDPELFDKYLKTSRLVVTHAGYATTMKVIKNSPNKPILFPRLKKFKEQVNDHQLHFANFMKKKGLVEVINGFEDFRKILPIRKKDRKEVNNYFEGIEKRRKKLENYLGEIV